MNRSHAVETRTDKGNIVISDAGAEIVLSGMAQKAYLRVRV
jgi:hypothetical protein